VGFSSLFGLLAYLSLSNGSLTVFFWLINITNTSGFISWVCCGVIYYRYKKAMKFHGTENPYKPRIQPWGIYSGAFGAFGLALLNGFSVFLPGQWDVSSFLTAYIGIPAFLLIYVGHQLWSRQPWVRPIESIDMHEGIEEVLAAERPPRKHGKYTRFLWALIE